MHKVAEQVGQTVFMVAARLLAKVADRLVGPVGAVEIRDHVVSRFLFLRLVEFRIEERHL